jgi:FkbM family methyltransferase
VYTTDKKCFKEFSKIVIEDIPHLRLFNSSDFDFIIDVGANIGIHTVYSKMLFPNAKIISIEPDEKSFDCLTKNTYFISDVYREKKAIGSGGNVSIVKRGGTSICGYTLDDPDGDIETITLQYIFEKYKLDISKNYSLKIDIEGAEKYLIGDTSSEDIIRGAKHFFMEIHFSSPKTPMFSVKWEEYNDWINKEFSGTHSIKYFKSNKHRGYGHYLLLKKEN